MRVLQIAVALEATESKLGFVRVQVREQALAKSHRPTRVLFTADRGLPLVASENNGELIFQATSSALMRLANDIEAKAELNVKVITSEETGEEKFKVSKHRSEVGSIASIRLNDNQDRVAFSARDALTWMQQPHVLGGYIVELFQADTVAAPEGARIEMTSLREDLEAIGQGLLVRTFDSGRPLKGRASTSAMSISFRDGLEGTQVELPFDVRPGAIALDPPGRARRPVGYAADIEMHHALLATLSEQALVRRVELPPLVEASPADSGGTFIEAKLAQPVSDVNYPVVGIIDGGVSRAALGKWVVADAGLVPDAHKDLGHGSFIAGLVSGAAALNKNLQSSVEPTGCKVFDLDIFPTREFRAEYYDDVEFFFDLLDEKVKRAKLEHRVRVFNLSFGLRAPGSSRPARRANRATYPCPRLPWPFIERLPRFKGCPWLVPNTDTRKPFVSIKHGWQHAIKEAKLPGLRLHDLRHSAASNMVNSGVDLFAVGKVLGHASYQSTQRYSHLANDTLLKAVEAGAAKQAAF